MSNGQLRILGILLSISVSVGAGAQPAASQPATTQPAVAESAGPAGTDTERIERLIALIEGQNSPAARRTGVHELLLIEPRAQIQTRLLAILDGANLPAQTAIAEVLAAEPHHLDPRFVDPFVKILSSSDEDARMAAATALAMYPDDSGLDRLRAFVADTEQPLSTRTLVIETLGRLARRSTVALLVEWLDAPESTLRECALATLERATGMSFEGDADTARTWWVSERDLPPAEWQQHQIHRLVALVRQNRQQLGALETRLAKALRTAYQRTPDAERPVILASYLKDPLTTVQLLGLELVEAQLADGKSIPPEVNASVRGLLSTSEAAVRAAAVRAVVAQRDPADGDGLLAMLAKERHAEVRIALVNGLGYVGNAGAVAPMLDQLERPDGRLESEILTTLGRLAEREQIDAASRPRVVQTLLKVLDRCPAGEIVKRERTLWAMSRVADPQFLPVFVAALDARESVGVRQAAVRGLAVLDDASATAALVTATADPDVLVRRQAVELLARWAAKGADDGVVQALFGRLATSQESDEAIRQSAWDGACRALGRRPIQDIERWMAQLPEDGASRARRAIQLLELEAQQLKTPETRAPLGLVQARIARQQVDLGEIDAALTSFDGALLNLHQAGATEAPAVAAELIRLALLNGRYTDVLAEGIRALNPPLNGQAVWDGLRETLEQRLVPEHAEQTVAALVLLHDVPPIAWPEGVVRSIEEMTGKAVAVLAEVDARRVNEWLAALDANPEDQAAKDGIVALGVRSVPALRERLRAIVTAEPPDAAAERRLHDLLKQVASGWLGFAADAPREDKLKALDALNG
ncbi:MAG: HEAT repeat domain-containing protein [Phycisphaerae bacterium]|nr:HEAT repeat domain-containing protein [Phycisphaerae bacterium]